MGGIGEKTLRAPIAPVTEWLQVAHVSGIITIRDQCSFILLPMIYTIGHSRHPIERFIALLQGKRMAYVDPHR